MIIRPTKVLIAINRHIGDVILTTPLIALLKEAIPDIVIDMLVNRGTGEFLEKDPRIRNVIYSDKWKYNKHGPSSGYLLALFRNYDLAISMNASDRGAMALMVASRRFRVGYYEQDRPLSRFCRKMLYSHPLLFQGELHTVMRCRQIAEAIGLPCEHLTVKIFYDSFDAVQVSTRLGDSGLAGPYFVIHPFARWSNKHWDLCNFVELSDQVAKRYNLTPVWTSSPDQEEIGRLTAAVSGCSVKPIMIPGIFSLNQIAFLIKSAKLYLGLDTAISHIAASVGVPMVALYGPTKMWCWHPWDNKVSVSDYENAIVTRGTYRSGSIVALQSACEHSPSCVYPLCFQNKFTYNPCMMALSAQDVFQEVVALLS
jgi:heptosyltransferase III